MSFEQQWDGAAYNGPFWASYITMLVLPLLFGILLTFLFQRRKRIRLIAHVLAALVCFGSTAWLTEVSIGMKWDARLQAATTDAERQLVADRDTANRTFAPIIGGVCGSLALAVEITSAFVARRWG